MWIEFKRQKKIHEMISIIGEQILDCRRKRAHRWPGNSRGAVLLRPKAENLKVSGPRRPTRLETEHVTSRRNRGDGERVRRILEILDDSSHVIPHIRKERIPRDAERCRGIRPATRVNGHPVDEILNVVHIIVD